MLKQVKDHVARVAVCMQVVVVPVDEAVSEEGCRPFPLVHSHFVLLWFDWRWGSAEVSDISVSRRIPYPLRVVNKELSLHGVRDKAELQQGTLAVMSDPAVAVVMCLAGGDVESP